MPAAQVERIRTILFALDCARGPEDLDGLPALESRQGDLPGCWKVWVTAERCVVFRFEGGDAWEVDLMEDR